MAIAFIGLGSNIGDREAHLASALEEIRRLPGTQLMKSSAWIETEPIGGPPQGKFLNGAAAIETGLPPETLLHYLQKIEQKLGRPLKRIPWGPRVIDLDLLTYKDLLLKTPELTLPHPRMQERPFVLIPLAEIAPTWRHPQLGKSAYQLLTQAAVAHAHRQKPG